MSKMALAGRLTCLLSPRSLHISNIISPAYGLHRVTVSSRWTQCICYSSGKRGRSINLQSLHAGQQQDDTEELSSDNTKRTIDRDTTVSTSHAQTGTENSANKTKFRSKLKIEAQNQSNIELEQVPISQEPKDTLFNFGKIKRSLNSMKEALAKKNLLPSELVEGDDSMTPEMETPAEDISRDTRVLYLPNPNRKRTLQQDYPETAKLVKHISNYKLLITDRNRFANAIPSIVGSSIKDVKAIVSDLKKAGLKMAEVRFVLPHFPVSLLEIDFKNVGAVYVLMKEEYNFTVNVLRGLLNQHPHIFTIDEEEIKARLELFTELGLGGTEIGTLLNHFPILLSVPLSERSIQAIKHAMSFGFDGRWLSKTLSYNMHMRPAKLVASYDMKKIVSLLYEYGVDVSQYAVKHPEILQCQVSQILPVIQTLSGKPLYLNAPDIHTLLLNGPHLLLRLKQMNALRTHLTDLCRLFGTADRVRWEIRSVKRLLDPQCDVNGKLELLSSRGFSEEEAVALLTKSPSVLMQNTEEELGPKLKLLLSVNGVTPSFLANASARMTYLHISHKLVQARCSFSRKYNESLLDVACLEDLLSTTDKEFATLCNQDLKTYKEAEIDSQSPPSPQSIPPSKSQSSVKSEDKADFNLIEAKTIHSNVPNGEDGNTNTDVQWECDSERDTHNRMPCSDVSIAAKLEQSITTVAENSDPPVEVIANLEQTALEDHCADIEPTEVNETNTENTSLDGVWLNESLNKEIADMLLELREATVVESERDAVMFGANTQEDVVDYLWDEFDERCDLEQNSVR